MKQLSNISHGEMVKIVFQVVNDKEKRESIKSAASAISRLLDNPKVNDPQSKEAQQVVLHCRTIKDVLTDL